MMRDEWLANTYGYQGTHFGIDYRAFNRDIDARMDYLKTNLFAAMIELGEAANEVPWKPWAKGDKQAIYEGKRDKFVGEMVDVMFFIANALTAVGVTDTELNERYLAKMQVNQDRQKNGYDGASTKCANCNGATDEPGMPAPMRSQDGRLFCSADCLFLSRIK